MLEIFRIDRLMAMYNQANQDHDPEGRCPTEPGWYIWEGLPVGPYETRAEALKAAMEIAR